MAKGGHGGHTKGAPSTKSGGKGGMSMGKGGMGGMMGGRKMPPGMPMK